MPQTKPPEAPYYPPRSGRLWVGNRAKVAVRAERAGSALASVFLGFLVAFVPGLPVWRRGHPILGMVWLGVWAIVLGRFLLLQFQGPAAPVRAFIPVFGTIQYESVYFWYGMAAAIHIASVNEFLRPALQARLNRFDLCPRFIITLTASAATAAFVYFTVYAPFLD